MENNSFKAGLRDGIAIGVGYLAVSFAFGIFATASGLSPIQALLVSMLNLTSAGQMAAIPMLTGGSVSLLFLSQLVINSRYALMSVSLSQVLSPSVTLRDRFLIGFINTDEIFGVAMGRDEMLGRRYFLALGISPYIGWSLGTLLGSIAGELLPPLAVTALSVSMYAMFIAIIVPESQECLPTFLTVLLAAALSSLFYYLPMLKDIPSGLSVVIVAVTCSLLFALVAPLPDEGEKASQAEETVK